MAKNGLKCITYAYKDVALDEVEGWAKQLREQVEEDNQGEYLFDKEEGDVKEEVRSGLESALTYVGTFGLNDSVRE